MKQLLLIFFVAGSLLACQPKGRVYVKHLELSPGLQWLKKDVREFKVPIPDVNHPYNLSLSFRYVSGYQFDVAKVKLTEISPSGIETQFDYPLKIRDARGDYLGDPALDIWDSEHVIVSNKIYSETGTYTYKIEHTMPVDPLNFVMEIGLILDEVAR